MADCTPRILPLCEPEELYPAAQDGCPNWETCLPWGGRLWSTDGCVRMVPGEPPEDGVYGKVIIANGCLVGVASDDIPQYMAAPCAPVPAPCSEVDAQQVDPSEMPGNLYTTDAAGRPLVLCRIEAGENTVVSGDGTLTNPYIISARIETQVLYAKSDNEAIAVTGAGTQDDPLVITHKDGHQGSIHGLIFDRQGHLVDVDGSATTPSGIQGIAPGEGIDVALDRNTNIATVSLEVPPASRPGAYQLGGYEVELDNKNRIVRIDKNIDLGDQQLAVGASAVTVNAQGSIEAIDPAPLALCFNFRWPAGAAATRRTGTFTMRYDAPLCGVLYTAGTASFFQKLEIYIDEVPCQLMPFGMAATNAHGVAFTGLGIFGVGAHTLDIRANEAWAVTAGAQVMLWPATLPDSTSEI